MAALESAGGNMAKGLTTAGAAAAGVGLAIGLPIVGAVKAAADFEFQIDAVSAALGGLDAGQMADIEQQALALGASTKFSAGEIAGVQEQLAKSGVSAEDILAGATDAVANMAAATGEDLATSAASAAAAINLFGLSGSDATAVADIFTAGLNNSSTSLSGLQQGVNNLGPVMANFAQYAGEPEEALSDTVAAIAYFNAQGLKAADAGVSLARAFTNLADPTSDASEQLAALGINAFDAEGNFIPLPDLMDQLQASMGGMSDQAREAALSTIFGAEAADVMNQAIKNGGDGLRQYEADTESAGQAAEQAAIRQDNLTGSIEELGGALETAAIALGSTLIDPIRAIADGVKSLVDLFISLPAPVQEFIGLMGALSSGLLLIGGGAALAAGKILQLAQAFSAAGLSLGKFALALGLAGLAIGAGILAYQNNILGFGDFVDKVMADAGKAVKTFTDTFKKGFAGRQAAGFNSVASAIGAFGEAMDSAFGTDLFGRMNEMGRAVQALDDGFWNAVNNGFNPAAAALGGLANAAAELGLGDLSSDLYRAQDAAQRFGDTFAKSSADAREAGYSGVADDIIGLGDAIDEVLGTEISPYFQRAADALNAFGVAAQEARDAGLSPLEQGLLGARDALGVLIGQDLGAFFDGLGENFSGLAEGVREVAGEIMSGDWQAASDTLTAGLQEMSDWLQRGLQEQFNNLGQAIQSIDLGAIAVNVGSWIQGQWDDLTGWLEQTTGIDLSDGVSFDDVKVALTWAKGQIDDLGGWIETTFGVDIPPLDLGTVEVIWSWAAGKVMDLATWLADALGIANAGGATGAQQGRAAALGGEAVSSGIDPIDLGQIEVVWEWVQSEVVTPLGDWLRGILTVDQSFVEEAGRLGEEIGTLVGETLVSAIQAGIGAIMGGGEGGEGETLWGSGDLAGAVFGGGQTFSVGDAFASFDTEFTAAVKEALEPEFEQAKTELQDWFGQKMRDLVDFIDEPFETAPTDYGAQLGARFAESLGIDPDKGLLGTIWDSMVQGADASELDDGGKSLVDSEGALDPTKMADQMATDFRHAIESPAFIDALQAEFSELDGSLMQPAATELARVLTEGLTTALAAPQTETMGDSLSALGIEDAPVGGGMAAQMVTAIANQLQTAIAAVDPGIFVGAGQALAAKLSEGLASALSATGTQGAELAGSGDIATSGGGIGQSLVTALAQSLQAAIAAAPAEGFAGAGSALMAKISEAMSAALSGDVTAQPGQLVGAEAAGGMGAGIVANLATSLAASITASPVESFAAVGAALSAKIAEVLNSAMQVTGGAAEGGGSFRGGDPGGAIGQQIAAMIATAVSGADFSAVGTALQAQLTAPMTAALTAVSTVISTTTNQWITTFSTTLTAVAGVVTSGMAQVTAAVTSGMTAAQTAVSTATNTMISAFATAGAAMATAMTSAMAQMVSAIQSGMGQAVSAVQSGVAAIQSSLAAAAGPAFSAGQAVGQGFANGISSMAGEVEAAAQTLANAAIGAITAVAKLGSPSKVTTEQGRDVGAGLAIGIEESAPEAEAAATDLGAVTVQSIAAAVIARLQEAIPELSAAFAEAFGVATEAGAEAVATEGEAVAEEATVAGEEAGASFGQSMVSAMLGQMELGGDGIGGQAIQSILGQLSSGTAAVAEAGRSVGQSLAEGVNAGMGAVDPLSLIPEGVGREMAERLMGEVEARRGSADSWLAQTNRHAADLMESGRPIHLTVVSELDGREIAHATVETTIGGMLDSAGRNPVTRRRR